MEQSWDVDEDLPAGPALDVIVRNRSWAAILGEVSRCARIHVLHLPCMVGCTRWSVLLILT